MGRKAVILPDGRVVGVDDATADVANLPEETVAAGGQRVGAAITEERFSGADDKVVALLEGVASGLTFGASDHLLDDEATRLRAKYNPGTRAGGELLGAILPSLVNPSSLAGRTLRASPAGVATRAGERVREGLGGVKGTIAQGAIEGVGGGFGQAVSAAALSDEPLTVEAAMESAGIGGLIGTGLGALAGAFGAAGRSAQKAQRAQEAAAAKSSPFDQVIREHTERRIRDIDVQLAATPDRVTVPTDRALEQRLAALDDELGSLQVTAPNADGARRRLEQIDAELAKRQVDRANGVGDFAPPVADEQYLGLRGAADVAVENGRARAAGRFADVEGRARVISPKEYRRAARAAGDDLLGQVTVLEPDAQKALKGPIARLRKAWGRLDASPGDYAAAKEHADAVAALAQRAGVESLPMPQHPAVLGGKKAIHVDAAAHAEAEVEIAASALRSLPKDARGFARLSDASRSHAIRRMEKAAGTEWGAPLKDALERFRTDLGVTEGSLAEGINRAYRDHQDVISGRLERLLKKERTAVERQMRAAASGSAKDVEAARRALMEEKAGLLAARKEAERVAQETAEAVRRALKDERKGLQSDLRLLADPADPKVVARTGDSWAKRLTAGAAAYAVGGPAGLMAEISGLRRAITGRIAEVIARRGETAERAIRRLGSPTARLGTSFLGHEDEDKRRSSRELAARRTEEILRLRPVVADAAYALAAPLAADAGHQFALALSERLRAAVDHLVQYLPRDPGTARHLLGSDWLPSDAQAEELAARLEAATAPLTALARLLAGDVDPAAAETLWALWPGVMEEARAELLAVLPEMEEVDMGTVAGLSAAFRTPFDGLLMPHNVAHLQSMYQGSTAPPPQPSGSGSGGKPGRPAATDQMTHAQSLTA